MEMEMEEYMDSEKPNNKCIETFKTDSALSKATFLISSKLCDGLFRQ
jgi:hypothetical protein